MPPAKAMTMPGGSNSIGPVPPKRERVARTVGHLFLLSAGAWGVFGTLPQSLDAVTHPWHLAIWALFMSTSLVAAVSSVCGKYLWEFAALPFMFGGCLIYIVAMFSVVVTGENPGSGIGLFMVSALASYLVARFFSLSQLVRNPLVLWRARALRKRLETDG